MPRQDFGRGRTHLGQQAECRPLFANEQPVAGRVHTDERQVPVTPIKRPVPVQVGVGFGGPAVRCCGGGAAAVGLCGAPCEAGDVGAAAVAVAAARLAQAVLRVRPDTNYKSNGV